MTETQDYIVNDGQTVNVTYDSIDAGAEDNDWSWYYVTATVTYEDGKVLTYTADPV